MSKDKDKEQPRITKETVKDLDVDDADDVKGGDSGMGNCGGGTQIVSPNIKGTA